MGLVEEPFIFGMVRIVIFCSASLLKNWFIHFGGYVFELTLRNFIVATEGNNKRAYEANRKIIRSTGALNGRGPYRGQQITINLPAGVDANNIKWLSVWCELFNINFGDVEFSVPS